MSNLRTICRPHTVFTSFVCCRHQARFGFRVSFRNPNCSPRFPPVSDFARLNWGGSWSRVNQRRTVVRASSWDHPKSPYETLELERDADDDQIKIAYRRLAKFYHPDVYDGRGTLEEGETAEARFIKIQAAYELLMDDEKRGQYDRDNRLNPMKASQAWMEWLIKKRKAFDQRGDMAIAAWQEQQQREMNIRARRLSRSKLCMLPDAQNIDGDLSLIVTDQTLCSEAGASLCDVLFEIIIKLLCSFVLAAFLVLWPKVNVFDIQVDPDEEKRILAREKKASAEYLSSTLKRHTLVLKKRDLMRKKAEEDKKKLIGQLLAAEGLELDTEDEEKR